MKNSKTLLGISLLGAILVSFGLILVKTDVTMAEDNHFYSEFNYVGIENVTENVYSISFWDKNTMFVTGGDDSIFHMSKIPVIIKSVHNAINGSISNILGGNHVNIGKSHNITVIGGKGIVKDGNTNATLFGGYENEIQYNTSLDTPTVLLGGKSNVVETGHDANVIVGGSSNTIRQGAQNVNILGGTDIFIDGNDVVAAGQKISGDVSDSFVFSDGIYNGIINLEGSGMFLLKVSNGVGFGTGTQDGNQGVASNGAISVGSININSVDCTESIPENVGLFGAWNGCLVGCTSGSAMVSKWEMLGYGDYCEQLCNSSDKCIAHPIDSWDIDYRSFCTAGFVDTSNASLCPGLSLEPYHNVIFETYLIDSEEECPSSSAVYNQCAFRCNEHAHLTGDKTGKMDGDTKCFNDCLLPWSESQYRGHNEIITGYSLTGVDCYDGAGVHDTCEPYRSNLMCVNGKRYEMENGIVTDTENTDYIYETCTLHSYTCDEEFNLTRENIVNDKKDFVEVWRYGNTNSLLSDFILNKIINPHLGYVQYSDIERNADEPTQEPGSMQMGVRGKYTLCIQYVPGTTPANQYPGNEQACVESSPLPEQYRYKFEECNEGYELAEDGVCRKLCEYDGQEIKHGSGIVLYTGETAICPEMCSAKNFICYDGILYADLNLGTNGKFISGTALDSNIYNYTGCTLSGAVCDSGYYNIDEVTYQSMKDIGIFSSCQSSWVFQNSCATGNRYHLDACNEGYYMSGDTCLPDEIINQCEINSSNFEDLDMYFITDAGITGHYTLMDRNLGATAYMNEPGKTTGDWYGCYYQWGNNYGFPNQGTVNTSTTQVDVLVYGSGNYYSSGTFITRSSSPYGWTTTANANLWGGNGSELDRQGPCPDEYHVPTKDEFVSIVNNYWTKSVDNNGSDQRSSDSLMPFAGYRYFASASVYAPYGYYGDYWSSTSDTSIGANCLHLNSIADPLPKYSYINSYGFSLRCFKNSPTQSLTLHPNGGTGALIILHGNEITKLGTPHKGNMIFEGWYSNQSFTPSSKVITGNTVSAGTHLYAKWGCAEGYVQSGDNCVVVYNCGGETPHGDNVLMGASTGSTQKLWTYKAEGDLGACEWRCHEGYIQSGNTCEIVPSYECVSNDYMFNTGSVVQIVGILPTSIGDVEKQLFASEDAIPNGQACAYVCNEAEGYHYFPDGGGICAKCEDGTESEVNGQLVCTKIIDVCPNPDEYAYVPETHTCEPYGNCTRAGQVKQGVIPVNSNITNLNSARPIGTSLMEWSCADDYYYTTYDISNYRIMHQSLSNGLIEYVQNAHNQCLYTCPSGSQCRSPFNDNIVGCAQDVHCEDWYPEYREYALTGENDPYRDAQSVGGAFGTEYKATRRSYLDSVTDAGDFYDEVERNPGVCWFWCPESHLCRLDPSTHQPTYDQNIWQCYETEDDRDANCIEGAPSNTQSYVCTTGGRKVNGSDYTLGGYSQFSRYAKGQNREFQTFAVQNGIAGHLSEGCYQGCTALAESGVVNYNGSQICWKQCSENQYFDVGTGQGCKSCANPSKKPNPDDVFLGNAMSCVDKCPAGSVRGPDYGHDGGEGCRFSVDAGSCPPDLETRIYDPGDGHLICVRDMSS